MASKLRHDFLRAVIITIASLGASQRTTLSSGSWINDTSSVLVSGTMSTTELTQFSFDEDTKPCWHCRHLDFESLPIKGKEYKNEVNDWPIHDEGVVVSRFPRKCERCRPLLYAIAAFEQKTAKYIWIQDALRLKVAMSPWDSASSWLEFYRDSGTSMSIAFFQRLNFNCDTVKQ